MKPANRYIAHLLANLEDEGARWLRTQVPNIKEARDHMIEARRKLCEAGMAPEIDQLDRILPFLNLWFPPDERVNE